ncbi:hypothetical protein [Desulfosporosinus fructosivorans]
MGGNGIILSQWKNRVRWMELAEATNAEDLQNNIITALRKLGYKGAVNDMLRAYFMDVYGISDITDGLAIHL